MDAFLLKFFPTVYEKEKHAVDSNQYCQFNSQLLSTFTSVLYFAAFVASFFASSITRSLGRKITMVGGGLIFLAGALVNGFASNVLMLIVGRIFLGLGVGFANQVGHSFLYHFWRRRTSRVAYSILWIGLRRCRCTWPRWLR